MPRRTPSLRVSAVAKSTHRTAPVKASRPSRRRDSSAARPAHTRQAAKPVLARSRQPDRSRKSPRLAAAKPSPTLVAVASDEEAPSSTARDLYLAGLQTGEPVSVVDITRSTADRPQLPDPQEVAAKPEILASLYDKRGRLVMPAPLRGSHEILVHQNEVADSEGLARVRDDDDLAAMRHQILLVALPVSGAMQVDDRLPADRRFCRPWTADFLAVLSRVHYARFHTPLQVNSAVRTVATQQHLLRVNGNAAPAAGDTASPHLTGQAVDIAKRGLSLSEIAWMRGYLLPLVAAGKIDVEEEFQQSCFHISVYKKYMGMAPALDSIAVTHRDRPAALAIMLR